MRSHNTGTIQTAFNTWIKPHWKMLTNASSLVGTMAVNSILGFVYWWIAARFFPQSSVGLASAVISSMMLLGTVSMLGLGTLLMGELPRQPEKRAPLITTALLVACTAGLVLGMLYAIITPLISPELGILASSPVIVLLFALGVSMKSVTLVLDQALIGLLRGEGQLWRNIVFSVSKLGILALIGIVLHVQGGLSIYATWMVGLIISLAALLRPVMIANLRNGTYVPEWGLLRGLGRSALSHHTLNLSLQAPGLILPILVTAILSTSLNASFYVAWMITAFVFILPGSLAMVLYAVGAAQPHETVKKIRLTLILSVLAVGGANLVFQVAGDWILALFGASYVEQAGLCLRILALSIFPTIVRSNYIAIHQIHNRVFHAVPMVAAGGAFSLVMAAIGASTYGLVGLSVGWTIGLCTEAVIMSPVVYRAATGRPIFRQQNETVAADSGLTGSERLTEEALRG
jgi:O-antigen/teichoic acid export membrane protein